MKTFWFLAAMLCVAPIYADEISVATPAQKYTLEIEVVDGKPVGTFVPIPVTPIDPVDPTPDPVEPTPEPEPPVVVPVAESPTGYTPKLLWSKEQQGVWNRMRAENHPWLKRVLDLVSTRTAANIYPYLGEHHVLAYQVTGNAAYGREAWKAIQPVIAKPPKDLNTIREDFIEYVIWYDWLTPALSEAERAEYLKGLNGWAAWAMARFRDRAQYRLDILSDSDQTFGMWSGLRLLDKVAGTTWCDQLPPDVIVAIRQYFEWARGGEWIESAPYNAGTQQLIAMYAAAMGKEAEPEIVSHLDAAALAYCYRITWDLQSYVLWGDVQANFQHARFSDSIYKWIGTMCLLSDRNTHLRGLIADLAKKHPTKMPWWRCLYIHNPYADSKDWRELPAVHFAEGQGLLAYKTADAMFVVHCPPRMAVNGFYLDHWVSYTSDFQLYKDGKWVVTHPFIYVNEYGVPHPANTLLLYGQQSMYDRTIKGWGETADGVWITVDTSGPYYRWWSGRQYYDPPPAFVEKATRTIRYEGGKIAIHDDVKASPPTRLDRYNAKDRARFTAEPVTSVIYDGAELVTRTVEVGN